MTRHKLTLTFLLLVGCSQSTANKDTGGMPAALLAIEGDAEDAYDKALLEDNTAVATDADKIDSAWMDYRSTAEADGASAATLSQLDDAIAGLYAATGDAGGSSVVGRAANAISAPMPALFDLYAPAIPSEVLALDYLGREVVLDGMDDDFTAAAVDVETLASTWQSIRSLVVDAGGQAEADDFDASVERLRTLSTGTDASALIDEGNVNLELVDVLEGVFEG